MADKGKFGIFVNKDARRNANQILKDAEAVGPYTGKLMLFVLKHYQGLQVSHARFSNSELLSQEEFSMHVCATFGIR